MGSGRVGTMRKDGRSPGVTFVLSLGSNAGNLSPCFLDLFAVSMSCGENFRLAGRFDESSDGHILSCGSKGAAKSSSSSVLSACGLSLLCLVVVSSGSGMNFRLAFGVSVLGVWSSVAALPADEDESGSSHCLWDDREEVSTGSRAKRRGFFEDVEVEEEDVVDSSSSGLQRRCSDLVSAAMSKDGPSMLSFYSRMSKVHLILRQYKNRRSHVSSICMCRVESSR